MLKAISHSKSLWNSIGNIGLHPSQGSQKLKIWKISSNHYVGSLKPNCIVSQLTLQQNKMVLTSSLRLLQYINVTPTKHLSINIYKYYSARAFATPLPPPPPPPAAEGDITIPKKVSWPALKKLIELAKPEVNLIAYAASFLVLSSGIAMFIPFSMGKVIDFMSKNIMEEQLIKYAPIIAAMIIIGAISNFGRTYCIKIAGESIVNRLRSQLFTKILNQDMAFFDRSRTGELINRLASDTVVVGKAITNNLSDGLRAILTASAGVSMMMYVSPKLTFIMLSIVPPIAICSIFYGRFVRHLSKKTQDALSEATKVAEEKISNVRTVRSFAQEYQEIEFYKKRVNVVFDLAKREAKATGFLFSGVSVAGNLSLLAALWQGGQMVSASQITVGALTSFLLYTVYVGSSVVGLGSFYSELMKGVGASSRIFELMDKSSTLSIGKYRLEKLDGKIEFKNLHFAYPTRQNNLIFRGLSLNIDPGTVIAFMGESGSGKSTIGSLLLRFYDPDIGAILLDGHDIRNIDPYWLRSQIAIVSQEPTLFAATIAENIAYGLRGKKDVSLEAIKAAAEKANAASFIERFPDKYNTYVGERGVSLSGGQKQRIAIARALLKDPKILILDEATSALDVGSEALVQEALDRLMVGRTVITIAHRLSTIRHAHQIAVLDCGKIIELGNYHELIKNSGSVFRKLNVKANSQYNT